MSTGAPSSTIELYERLPAKELNAILACESIYSAGIKKVSESGGERCFLHVTAKMQELQDDVRNAIIELGEEMSLSVVIESFTPGLQKRPQ